MLLFSVVIPVFNRSDLTRKCLDALLAQPQDLAEGEIIIANDGSTDDTLTMLASYGENIRVVNLPENQGFASACNAGAAAAQGKYLVFLNNDTLPQAGWLTALRDYQTVHPHVAALGARLLFPDGTVQHAGVIIGQDRNPWHIYAGFPGDHPAVCKSRRFQIVTGACLWMRRELFHSLGGFDTKFQNGYEDVDLCLRLGAEGHEIHYCHECVIVHLESQSRVIHGEVVIRNNELYRQRWAECIAPDDLNYYLADGLLQVVYGQRHSLWVDKVFHTPAQIEEAAEYARLRAEQDSLKQALSAAQENAARQAELAAQRDAQIAALELVAREREQHNAVLEQTLTAREERIAFLERIAAQRATRLAGAEQLIEEQREQMRAVKHSRSWKLTRPFRQLRRRWLGWPAGD